MEKPRLIIGEETEFVINGRLTTIGRGADNDIAVPDDSNISRFHAEIENRDGEFWLFDLNSSNGTKLNGEAVTTEKPLNEGDIILLGGSTELVFTFEDTVEKKDKGEEEEDGESADTDEGASKDAEGGEAVAAGSGGKKFTLLLVFAALAIGLAIVLASTAALFYFMGGGAAGGSACTAKSTFISPENGDILSEPTEVEIAVDDAGCVTEAAFLIDGKEFDRAKGQPFKVSLDPSKFPQMSDGTDRKIKVVLIGEDGKEIPQNDEIAISIETLETETPEATPASTPGGQQTGGPTGPEAAPAKTSLIETQGLAAKVTAQFSNKAQYNTNNPRFIDEVSKMTAEYVSAGYYERAAKYRDVINYQYVREQNLDPQLGYILAMSRTKFQPANKAEGAGLWRMNNQLVLENAYNGICGAETIASETQRCAAIASSTYLKDIVLNVFNGDIVYGVAAFGMDKQEAAAWNAGLPTDPAQRQDFWNVIKDPGRREQVVRFFAAAIVAENPQKFGLLRDKPISALYPAYGE